MENLSLVGGLQDLEIRRFRDRGASKWDGELCGGRDISIGVLPRAGSGGC